MSIFYRPNDGTLVDVIPFYWQGVYHLFYLKDYRDVTAHGEGTPWFHIATSDFVHFEEWGEAIPRGALDSPDPSVFTGSVIERDGLFHIFYTGHNPHLKNTRRPVQILLHATSRDLKTWTKDLDFAMQAPPELDRDDWRDPFVFWNEEGQCYWMLISARRRSGPSRHRGFIAVASSDDLREWKMRSPLWEPNLYSMHECPDLFRIGDWWYLVYSTFTDRQIVHYRMSRSLKGPWLCPADDAFDAELFYAAKTAGDGEKRFLFGWLPTLEGETDEGGWQWGGNLVTHQLTQRADGTLAAGLPGGIESVFTQPAALKPRTRLGQWKVSEARAESWPIDGLAALSLGPMPEACVLETTIRMSLDTVSCGLLLRADKDLEAYYQVRLELNRQRLVFDRWPRQGTEPFIVERPVTLQPDCPIKLRVLIDFTCAVAYIDNEAALSCRLYNHKSGNFGLFVSEGGATFEDIFIKTKK